MGQMAANQRTGHPWANMSDRQLVQSAQLFQRDFQTGKKGFSLAAVLLLGDDQVILSVLPHHRTDALLRRENIDRYDDRDDIRTNLLDSFDRLMAFTAKHLSAGSIFLGRGQSNQLKGPSLPGSGGKHADPQGIFKCVSGQIHH